MAQAEPVSEQSSHFDAKARAGKKDIVEVLRGQGHFATLLKAFAETGLLQSLKLRGPLTLFAPTDEAFAKLAKGSLARWQKDPKLLKPLLRYHILKAYVPAKQVFRLRNALTASGAIIRIDLEEPNKIVLNFHTRVTQTDLLAANGVIHAIDTVLAIPERQVPKGKAKKGESPKDESEKVGGDDS